MKNNVYFILTLMIFFIFENSNACNFGRKPFSCCQRSQTFFEETPYCIEFSYEKFGGGCAVNKAEAEARCGLLTVLTADYWKRMAWNTNSCPETKTVCDSRDSNFSILF